LLKQGFGCKHKAQIRNCLYMINVFVLSSAVFWKICRFLITEKENRSINQCRAALIATWTSCGKPNPQDKKKTAV